MKKDLTKKNAPSGGPSNSPAALKDLTNKNKPSGGSGGPQACTTLKKGKEKQRATHARHPFVIPRLVDEREHTPPPGFQPRRGVTPPVAVSPDIDPANASQFGGGIVLPPAWARMEDMDIDELDQMVIAGPSSRTCASDRIRGIFRCTEVVELDGRLLVVDLEGLELGGFAFQTSGGRSVGRGGAGGAGGAATSGAGRGGAATTSGVGGGSAAAAGSKLAGKCIVTTIVKGVQIMKAKRKRTNPGWKP
ncbi:hypothetical protein FH972_002036 [Carpinus fangiana]|uniref:Uncharacterized protein n=1 Tax=Carpinus fangiana TaxID=176857 RepID=A0A5N6QE43_9ROSI|nr:hypothetical protein FH972_002036 [Carpinus fangiana]